ncbi:amidase family protein [Fulvimarina sp. MAC3]|uniref:amidase family protein n=1 Tax=Fulvimarina sp. MAC3 TaxID=3148887 RepID=UPI0031FC2548
MRVPSFMSQASGRLRFRAVDRAADAVRRVHELGEATAGTIFTRFNAAKIVARAETVDRDSTLKEGLLAGALVTIKDLFDEEGEVTTAGSRQLEGASPATSDAEAVRRLLAAGAVPFGRTSMTEFAYSGIGLNPHFGTPGNSHDPERIPGGSTSGGAIAVAYGLADAALGSDTGGSLRIPAAFNALAGFKPTQSSVSLEGGFPLSKSYDSFGAIAPEIATCAAIHAVLSGDALPQEGSTEERPLRFAVMRTLVTDDMDEAVTRDFDGALERLEEAGHDITDVTLDALSATGAVNRIIVAAEAHGVHRDHLNALETSGDPRVLKRIRAAETFSEIEISDAYETRKRAVAAFKELASGYDAILMPTVPIVAPLIEEVEDDFDRLNALVLRNPSTVNFVDGCAATVPMHSGDGLPTGLMIVGPAGCDWRVLQIADMVEALLAEA